MPLPKCLPHPGEILICDFNSGFAPPEMVKKRPSVVVSRRDTHGRGLCTVVPLSTTEPVPPMPWHHKMPHLKITSWQNFGIIWAKCDMLATVSFNRLDRPYTRTRHGRVYQTLRLDEADLEAIRAGMLVYLGLRL